MGLIRLLHIEDKSSDAPIIKDAKRIEGTCAGKGCNRIGTITAKIVFIEKEALFCESCNNDLKKSGIILDNLEGS